MIRKIFLILGLLLFLFSCQRPINETPWMECALKYKGKVYEREGGANDPLIVKALVLAGFKAEDIDDNKIGWCASWLGYILHESGITPTYSALGSSYRNFGVRVKARKGAIAITKDDHVAFLVSTRIHKTNSGDCYELLGGNQTDRFQISLYKITDIDEFRMPTKKDLMENHK